MTADARFRPLDGLYELSGVLQLADTP